jgi:hypothetical protein
MAEEKTYPFIPYYSWWKLRKELKSSIPTKKVDGKFISGIIGGGMRADYAAWNIIPQLKKVKLLDENNIFDKDNAHKFREDSSYKEFCDTIISETYPENLSIIADSAISNKEDVSQAVRKWFSDDTKKGASSVRNFATFYLLLKEGDYTKADDIPKQNSTKTKTESKLKEIKTTKKDKEESPKPTFPPQPVPTGLKVPDMNINVQIHISADSTPEQIENIFKYMSKYLYNKE